jgi:hypothetical protein
MLLVAGRTEPLREQQASVQRTLASLLGNDDLQVWLTVVAAARLGETERAAQTFRGIGRLRNTARMERVNLMEAAVLAGVRDYYERQYAAFDPTDDSNACWGPFAFVCAPPIARTLAMAAFALGREGEAVGHCARALELTLRGEADAHRAWVHLAWGEGAGSTAELDRAVALAERLEMPEILERAAAARGRPARPAVSPEAARLTLRQDRDGEWTLEHGGRSFRLPDVRGLGMLARLLAEPGREIHALDLVSAGGSDGDIDLGDAGEVIDLRARNAYRTRIAALREELEEAEGFCDGGRADRLRSELEALTDQIAAAVGLGGRERRSGSAAERARITAGKRIREAIKKIAREDGALGKHLERAVRTGTFCVYDPTSR